MINVDGRTVREERAKRGARGTNQSWDNHTDGLSQFYVLKCSFCIRFLGSKKKPKYRINIYTYILNISIYFMKKYGIFNRNYNIFRISLFVELE